MAAGEITGSVEGGPPPMVYLARRALRFWRSAVAVFVVAIVVTLVFARQTWQPYMSEAVLMFAEGPTREMGGTLDPSMAGARLKGMLMSGDRLRIVIQKHDLFPDYTPQHALEEVKKRLDFQVGAGGTFSVKYTGFSPQQAQAVLSDLTQSLVADHDLERGKALKESRELLDIERRQLQEEVARNEVALNDFLAKNPQVALLTEQAPTSADPNALLVQQQIDNLKRERAAGATRVPTASTLTDLFERKRLAEAERDKRRVELDELRATKTEAHPDVVSALQKLKSAEADINRVVAQIERAPAAPGAPAGANPLDGQIQALTEQLTQIRMARSARGRSPKLLQLEVAMGSLREQLAQSRERLNKIEDKRLKLGVQEQMETSGNLLKLVIHDPATLPGSPLQSRRRRSAMVGFVIACMLAAGAALGRATASDRIFDKMDVVQLGGANVLAVVPPVPRRFRSASE
jgi:uncharacterized protein involved in exopolysaccharide biosynthesis